MNDVLAEIDATQLCQYIIDARRSLVSPSTWVTTPKINRSIYFIPPTSSLTPKIYHVGSSFTSEWLSTYYEPVHFFDI